MNVQLPLAVSNITGVTGLRILRDIVAGQRDPQHLVQHRDDRCHASKAEIVAALTGCGPKGSTWFVTARCRHFSIETTRAAEGSPR